jgi:hypothetical protein
MIAGRRSYWPSSSGTRPPITTDDKKIPSPIDIEAPNCATGWGQPFTASLPSAQAARLATDST